MLHACCRTGRERSARLLRSAAGLLLFTAIAAPALAGGPGPGPAGPFSGCGVLAIGPQGCEVFIRDDGASAFIENVAPFQPGDRVWVSGILNPVSQICGPFQAPGIENNTIGECFEGCGTLAFGPHGCNAVFLADDGELYAIENTGSFTFGDRVWVRGCLNFNSVICFPPFNPAIEDNEIGRCFSGCGTLVATPIPECPLTFQADSGERFILDDIGNFLPGDRVWVTGCVDVDCANICDQSLLCLRNNTIGRCFEGCGTLEFGPQGCTVFRANDGNASFFIENTDGFGIGDSVWVSGCVNPQSTLCAPFTAPGLEDNTIAACFSECGTIGPGPQGCPVFRPLGSNAFYFIENIGTFGGGDRVWVEGCLNPQSRLCLPFTAPGIERNTIAECFAGCGRLEPTPIPECVLFISDCGERFVLENTGPIGRENRRWVTGCVDRLCNQPCFDAIPCLRNNTVGQCLDACGVLVRGAECTLVATPIGEVVVQNLGNFEVGDFVRIIGCFDPECVTFCQQGVGCVTQNEIRPGCRCDMNCDGTVDFFDIDPFLLALFDRARYAELYPECDPRNADASGDCNIDFFDIDPFLDCLFLDG